MNLQVFFEGQPQVLEWGVVRLDKPLPNAGRLEAWVGQGMHAGLRYMEERLEERLSPPKLFPWAKSAVIFSIRQPVPFGADTGAFRLASYALGEDYHHIARRILNAAEMHVRTVGATHGSPLPFVAPIQFAGFCDTWPVFERDLAAEAGLGWRGKNATIIHRKHGSGFLLAGFFLDVDANDLESSAVPQEDFCGGCTACLDECPTDALVEPGRLDASKCLSYWTIEAKGEVPESISEKSGSWIFGCDICQEVCPWNHKHKKNTASVVSSSLPNTAMDWLQLLRKGGGFQSRFKNTPFLRAGRRALLRNTLIALRHGNPEDVNNVLKEIQLEEDDPVVLGELKKTLMIQ